MDALVLSSPALDAGLSPVQKAAGVHLPSIAPNLRVGNGLDANYLSHDAQVVADLRPTRAATTASARLARLDTAGPATVAAAPTWGCAHLADVGGG